MDFPERLSFKDLGAKAPPSLTFDWTGAHLVTWGKGGLRIVSRGQATPRKLELRGDFTARRCATHAGLACLFSDSVAVYDLDSLTESARWKLPGGFVATSLFASTNGDFLAVQAADYATIVFDVRGRELGRVPAYDPAKPAEVPRLLLGDGSLACCTNDALLTWNVQGKGLTARPFPAALGAALNFGRGRPLEGGTFGAADTEAAFLLAFGPESKKVRVLATLTAEAVKAKQGFQSVAGHPLGTDLFVAADKRIWQLGHEGLRKQWKLAEDVHDLATNGTVLAYSGDTGVSVVSIADVEKATVTKARAPKKKSGEQRATH